VQRIAETIKDKAEQANRQNENYEHGSRDIVLRQLRSD